MLGILVVAGSLASVALAHADPAPLPAAASGGWQSLIDPRFRTSRAPMIGRCGSSPRTPVYAVESYLKCVYRGEPKLCRNVAPDSQFLHDVPEWEVNLFYGYRVTASRPVRPGGKRGASAAPAAQAADWTITTEERLCTDWPPKHCLDGPPIRRVWSLARSGPGWVVLGDPVVAAPAALREALNVVRPAEQAPPGWRLMGTDARSSTSRCIGDPRTPRCAIETAMACEYWADTDQCEKVWVSGVPVNAMLYNFGSRGDASFTLGSIVQYRVAEVRKVPPSKDGTSLWVRTQERLCRPGTSYCETGLPRIKDWGLGQEHGRCVVTTPGVLVFGTELPYMGPPAKSKSAWSPSDAPLPGWSRLGHDRAGSTSRCIGDPRTARCAVETYQACWRWRDLELCRLVMPEGASLSLPTPPAPEDGAIGTLVEYRFTVDHRFPRPYEMRNPANLDLVARGATWSITALERFVDSNGSLGDPEVYFWYLTRQDGRWVVVEVGPEAHSRPPAAP